MFSSRDPLSVPNLRNKRTVIAVSGLQHPPPIVERRGAVAPVVSFSSGNVFVVLQSVCGGGGWNWNKYPGEMLRIISSVQEDFFFFIANTQFV